MKETLLEFRVDNLEIDSCCNDIFRQIQKPTKGWLACLNPHSYAVSRHDEEFRDALYAADWLVPDGVGVVIASRILGGGIRKRVTGSDIFFGLNQRMNAQSGMTVFFLGSTEQVLSNLRNKMLLDYPNVSVAGTYSPPFRSEYTDSEESAMIEAINSAKADVLWVAMTAPKQEKWINKNLQHLNVNFVGAIGAVFDFYTGEVKRSPLLFRRLGLEWLPRLLNQPKRLWRRMFISAPIFLFDVFKAILNRPRTDEPKK